MVSHQAERSLNEEELKVSEKASTDMIQFDSQSYYKPPRRNPKRNTDLEYPLLSEYLNQFVDGDNMDLVDLPNNHDSICAQVNLDILAKPCWIESKDLPQR